MTGMLYMAWKYLLYHRVKTVILILSITLIVYIPVGLRVLVRQSERQLTERAEATPLLIGAKGSPLELVLNSLYFSADVPETMLYGEVDRIARTGFAVPIPFYVRFHAGDDVIVGTTLDYFALRGLRLSLGSQMTRLGDCIVGSALAQRRGVSPGDHIVSSPENVFDLAGVYPLKMRVVGVLERSESPDDDAVFVDVKTAWVIQGLAHGHEDLSRPEAAPRVLKREGNVVVGNAAVVQYTEITDANIDSFHFHGKVDTFPLTAIIAVPRDYKSATLLMGRYEAGESRHQAFKPIIVIDELLSTILTVQSFVVAALGLVGIATLATGALVFMLSLRLRRREIETMVKIGGSRRLVGCILATEMTSVLVVGITLAAVLTWFTGHFAASAVRLFILG